MKTIDEFLSELRRLDVKLWNDGDRLRYKASKETLTPALLQELRERKVEMREFLHKVNAATSSNPSPILPVPRDGNLRLSFAQARLWFLAQLEPDSSAYNMPAAYRLTGLLNVTALSQSLSEIVRRHEVLRTTFPSVDGQPKQVISLDTALTLPVIDLRELPADQRLSEAQHLATKEAQQPFDLATGPLFRVKLLHLEEAEHMLVVTIHHIVYDGWSYDIFFQELAALYDAFSSGKPSTLPELSIQYADFTVWQREWLQGEILESQLNYWKKQLGGDLAVLQLPIDYPRPPIQTYRGAQQFLELPPDLTESLKALCQQEGTTLYMVLLSAFQILLSRYSGQEDIIVGTPIAGRNRLETEGLIGLFINTLVLRTDLSGNPNFQELLERVREVALGAYAHQDLPFEKLVEELQPERNLSHTPLFQVWFNMVNLADNHLYLPGLTVESLPILETPSKFDLTLYVREQDRGIRLDLVYNADLFAPERMVEMLAQFNHLLVQIVAHPKERIAQFSLVTPTAELLLPDPSQALASEDEEPIQARFSQQAQRVPAKLAVVDTQVAWTYKELDTYSNQLANYLLEHGIEGQDIIAIYGHRSALLVWAILGVLKAGAAFVILDPAYPASRLINYLSIVKPRGWLQLEGASSLPAELEKFLTTLSFGCSLQLSQTSVLKGYSTNNPEVVVDLDNLAYVAFTSGSTGMPKGIKGTHRPLSHFLKWHCQTFGLNQSDRCSLLSGLSHDPLLRDIFTPLWLGATLCIPEQQDIDMPGRLAEWMWQQKVSIAHLTPAMGGILAETLLATSKIPSLRYVFFAGDLLTKHDVARIRQVAPGATYVNFYGATETPQAMGYFVVPNPNDRIEEGKPASLKESIPLGRGIADAQLLVLNATQQLAGIGELGEIHVRTPYLAKGYMGDNELSQKQFIINPFTKTVGDLIYKTGDLGCYLPDGNIEFIGRLDNQVKIRGFRIELGEIEAVIAQHPAVRTTVVIAREDVPGNKRLVAYVVPNQEQAPTIGELRSFLQQKLPEYMVPSAFVMLDSLPLTPNGKVDRRALLAPDQIRQGSEEPFVAPRDGLELQLTKIWEQVLGIQPISIKDNFFSLGGHSLLAVRLFAQIKKSFGKNLPLATLFQTATVEQLASVLRQEIQLVPWSLIEVIPPNGSKQPLFWLGLGYTMLPQFVKHLGVDQPVYGITAGRNEMRNPTTHIKEWATGCIEQIRAVQPEGPYFLGGYCLGGFIALEIAQQLQAHGQEVALLALVETESPDPIYRFYLKSVARFRFHKRNLSQLGTAEQLTYILKPLAKRIKAWTVSKFIKRNSEQNVLTHNSKVNNLRKAKSAGQSYTMQQAYPGRVAIFFSKHTISKLASFLFPQYGWGKLVTGELELYVVPGDHASIVREPHVQALAGKLSACLVEIQEEGRHCAN